MKRRMVFKTEQYAYTTDGRVIKIQEILKNGEKYRGFNLEKTGSQEVELEKTDVYGVVFGLGNAV